MLTHKKTNHNSKITRKPKRNRVKSLKRAKLIRGIKTNGNKDNMYANEDVIKPCTRTCKLEVLYSFSILTIQLNQLNNIYNDGTNNKSDIRKKQTLVKLDSLPLLCIIVQENISSAVG